MQNSVVNWLEKTAISFSDNKAFIDDNKEYIWKDIRYQALSIANSILNNLDSRKQPIAIYMKKSADMLIAYLGVAYSGNFYSPIDVDMPKARADKILRTLSPKLIITSRSLNDNMDDEIFKGYKVLCIEDIVSDDVSEEDANKYVERIIDTDLLYVLFTSGSTGTPKGVAITHRGVIDYIDWVTKEFDITEKDSFGNQAPFYFDNSILDIYSAVKTGASVYIIPPELFSQPVKLLQYLLDKSITTIFWVPSALVMVSALKALKKLDVSKTLKRVMFCGEVMPNKHLNIWRKHIPNAIYANLYGPTEITDACTYYIVDRKFNDDESLPIGKPMKNTDVFLLDDNNNLIEEPDKIGELCVRGTSLAVGYYNNPEKTKEAFVQNPLQSAYSEIIYRTGDLVKYNDRNEIIYICRKDYQIKHLGHRIELGEIETAVSSLDDISMCCCIYNDERNQIVLFLEQEILRSELNEKLRPLIPEYMLPGKVISIDKMPLNANGKIDRVALKKEYLS